MIATLTSTAWSEYCVNASYRGDYISDYGGPPAWFYRDELGFDIASGPSLNWTCLSLARSNRSAIIRLGTAAPLRVTYPKDFVKPSSARRSPVKGKSSTRAAQRRIKHRGK